MKKLSLIFALLVSAQASADCQNARLLERPEVPDGRTATMDEMLQARGQVLAYIDGARAYLDCVEPEPFVHNHVVNRIERVARVFNTQRDVFLQRQEVIASS